MKRQSLDERVVDSLLKGDPQKIKELARAITELDSDEFASVAEELFGEDVDSEDIDFDEVRYKLDSLSKADFDAYYDSLVTSKREASFTPESELNAEAETPWSFDKDKGEIARKSRDKEFLSIEEVDDICPSCAKRMHAKGITRVSAKAFAKQLKGRR